MAKILLVEDDPDQAQMICDLLSADGHHVESTAEGWDALSRLKLYGYDLMILDWELPDLSGLQLLKHYRTNGGDLPVLMLTGRREISDKESGLDLGSDDYLTKPYDARELTARVRALLRRPRVMTNSVLKANDIELDPVAGTVYKSGVAIRLKRQEYLLLEFFMRNPNRLFSGEALIDRVWNNDDSVTTEAVRTSIKRLRQAIDSDEASGSMITTVHRSGYRFDVP
jgi:DNA-binding response OmpR family regulator